jgi:ADP-heptose:LPS heptosyltransferase
MFRRLLAVALELPDQAPARPPLRQRRWPASEKPVVGLSGLQAESRALSDGQWEEFIRARLGARPFWIASSETDRAAARRLARRFHGQAEVFEEDFPALCRLIQQSAQVLTVDGGFLHVASYYGVPVAALFTSGRDRKWAPLAPGSRTFLRTDLSCRPCVWFGQAPPCRNGFACKQIPLRPMPLSEPRGEPPRAGQGREGAPPRRPPHIASQTATSARAPMA